MPTVVGRPRLAASTLKALVSMEGMRGLRKTLALVEPVSCTEVTGPIRPIIAGAALGSSAVPPKRRLAVLDGRAGWSRAC